MSNLFGVLLNNQHNVLLMLLNNQHNVQVMWFVLIVGSWEPILKVAWTFQKKEEVPTQEIKMQASCFIPGFRTLSQRINDTFPSSPLVWLMDSHTYSQGRSQKSTIGGAES
jgi:hypothetical protein